MSDEQEISISDDALHQGIKIEAGATHVFVVRREGTGCLSFVLLSEAGLQGRSGQAFTLTGHGLNLSGTTDEHGEYLHDPAEFGEYELKVGEDTYRVPAVHRGSQDSDWEGPLEHELDGVAPEDAALAEDADEDA